MKTAKEKLERFHILRIPIVFLKRVLAGYRLYSNLIKKYGEQTEILATTWQGTGDYYICGLYLKAWIDKNEVNNFIFLTPGGAEERVLSLFQTCQEHMVNILDKRHFVYLLSMKCFLGRAPCHFHNLHNQQTFPYANITGGYLRGFHGLNMVDYYLTLGYKLDLDAPKELPRFTVDKEKIEQIFQENHLKHRKTVLIAPYTTGLAAFSPPQEFWIELAQKLSQAGFSVCSNCAGEEKAIKGTVRIELPFRDLVPFLNIAGYFVGIRSGLCEVISMSSCEKVILHTYKSKWWPDGSSIAYTGLKSMNLSNNVKEHEISSNDTKTLNHLLQARLFNDESGNDE